MQPVPTDLAIRRDVTCRPLRKGSYAVLFGLMIVVLMGFGALALDTSMIRLAQSQTQDVADAASQGALLSFRKTQSLTAGEAAAAAVVARNDVLGAAGTIESVEWGNWIDGAFVSSTDAPSAARVRVGRSPGLVFARLWGHDHAVVSEQATSAARPMDVVLVMDITNSWTQANFAFAREAALAFYDRMEASHGPDDRLGMVVFTGRYGVEHTPLMTMAEHQAAGTRLTWSQLRTASKAGVPNSSLASGCSVYGNNNFASPPDGCFPQMWREYTDEYGTDHTTGMTMAQTMLFEGDDHDQYRAMIVLTDGYPNGTGPHLARDAAGYEEARWRSFETPVGRTTSQVITDSIALAEDCWFDGETHIWTVSFVADATFLASVAQGDGYYVRTTTASALVPVFEDIAESLPLGLVE